MKAKETIETYIITDPNYKSHGRFRLSESELVVLKKKQEDTMKSFLVFIATLILHFKKDWKLTQSPREYGWEDVIEINGKRLQYKFGETSVGIDNGGDTHSNFYKKSMRLMYDKPLTMEDHGKKFIEVIQSQLDYYENTRIQQEKTEANDEISKAALKYLVEKHNFPHIKTRSLYENSNGYQVEANNKSITLYNKHGKLQAYFVFSTEEESYGKLTLQLSKENGEINIAGSYPNLDGFHSKMKQLIDAGHYLETEYKKIAKLLPEAIAYVTGKAKTKGEFLVDIIESERGWGRKVDETKDFATKELADTFVKEYNSKNNEPTAPDWYMYASPRY